MITNLFKTVNKGKGIIFNPVDNYSHPIVGGCLSPRVPALDCITSSGTPSWVTTARTAANYDATVDATNPPSIATATTVSSLKNFGGFCLRVNNVVCSLHPTLGIFRNLGKLFRSVFNYTKTEKQSYGRSGSTTISPIITTPVRLHSRYTSYDNWSHSNPKEMIYLVWELYYYTNRPPLGTAGNRMFMTKSGSNYNFAMDNYDSNNNTHYLLTNSTSYTCMIKVNQITTTETDTIITPDISQTLGNYVTAEDNALYIKPDLVTSGITHTTSGTKRTGVYKLTDALYRDTEHGFFVATDKGMVVHNELRRNFLRVSPTVFKHTGGF